MGQIDIVKKKYPCTRGRGPRFRSHRHCQPSPPLCIVVMEIGNQKLLDVDVTPRPTSWVDVTAAEGAIPSVHAYRWWMHDRSRIFAAELGRDLEIDGPLQPRVA